MSETILVVDDKNRIAQRVKDALGESTVFVNSVADARSAKQLLVQSEVSLILSDVTLGADTSAGVTLCKQLREHERFCEIPVILVSDALGDELIRAASECGAQGLVGWPFPLDSIKKRVLALLSQNALKARHAHTMPVTQAVQTPPKPAAKPASAAPAQAAAKPSPPSAPQVDPESATVEDKLKRAQHLLALVLHNLKTSNLLDLIELEDIPGIVLQMTRNVCGEGSQTSAANNQPQDASKPATQKSDEVSMDLDSVFGIKK